MNQIRLMSTKISFMTLPQGAMISASLSPARGAIPGRLRTALALLAILWLVTAMLVSGSFLIARGISVLSADQITHAAGQLQEQLAQGNGADGDKNAFSGLKRMRGAPASKVSVGAISAAFAATLASYYEYSIEDADVGQRPIFTEPEPDKDTSLPQELLRRPPPARQ